MFYEASIWIWRRGWIWDGEYGTTLAKFHDRLISIWSLRIWGTVHGLNREQLFNSSYHCIRISYAGCIVTTTSSLSFKDFGYPLFFQKENSKKKGWTVLEYNSQICNLHCGKEVQTLKFHFFNIGRCCLPR